MRIERKIGASVVVLGSLLLALSSAVPALASSGPAAGFGHVSGLRLADTANATSPQFGGWAFGVSTAKSVTAEFKVPTLTCTKTDTGIGPQAALQSGSSTATVNDVAGLLLGCAGGKPGAEAFVVLSNTETNDTTNGVFVGDLMQATVTISASKTTATIADLTKGHTFKFTKSGAGGKVVDEAIIDGALENSSNKQLPVVNFGTISYSKGAVSGKAIGSVKPNEAINMQTAKGVLQILTGKITGSGKNAFTTTWKHS